MAESDFAGEWHHVEINGEVRESHFTKPEHWDAVVEDARALLSESRSGLVSRDRFIAEAERDGLRIFMPYEGSRTVNALDNHKVVRSFYGIKRGRVTYY